MAAGCFTDWHGFGIFKSSCADMNAITDAECELDDDDKECRAPSRASTPSVLSTEGVSSPYPSEFEHTSCKLRDFHQLDAVFARSCSDGFNYHEFMRAFRTHEKSKAFPCCGSLKMVPDASWFDVEMAHDSRPHFFTEFRSETMQSVKEAATMVNRWNFMKVCMVLGEDWMTCTLPYVLLLLAVIHETVDLSLPKLRSLLVAAWAQMTAPDAEIWGLELDRDIVHIARREIFETEDSFAGGARQARGKIRVARGDVMQMVAGSPASTELEESAEEMFPFPDMYFDVITMGVCVSAIPHRIVECLNEGGVLVLPAQVEDCSLVYDEGAVRTKCQFEVWRKQGGKLIRMHYFNQHVGDGLRINFIASSECSGGADVGK